MKILTFMMLVVVLMVGLFGAGCSKSENHSADPNDLKTITQHVQATLLIVQNHLQDAYDKSLAKCEDPQNCESAEKYQTIITCIETAYEISRQDWSDDTGQNILAVIEAVLPLFTDDDEDIAVYIRDIQILLSVYSAGQT